MNSLVLTEPSRPPRSASDPDPEVPAKARRRRFAAKYKLRILAKADRCSKPGDVGELLRQEGLYSSLLSRWREQREAGALAALRPKKRGRKPQPVDPRDKQIATLTREKAAFQRRAERAEALVEVQKKLSQLLGIALPTPPPEDE